MAGCQCLSRRNAAPTPLPKFIAGATWLHPEMKTSHWTVELSASPARVGSWEISTHCANSHQPQGPTRTGRRDTTMGLTIRSFPPGSAQEQVLYAIEPRPTIDRHV